MKRSSLYFHFFIYFEFIGNTLIIKRFLFNNSNISQWLLFLQLSNFSLTIHLKWNQIFIVVIIWFTTFATTTTAFAFFFSKLNSKLVSIRNINWLKSHWTSSKTKINFYCVTKMQEFATFVITAILVALSMAILIMLCLRMLNADKELGKANTMNLIILQTSKLVIVNLLQPTLKKPWLPLEVLRRQMQTMFRYRTLTRMMRTAGLKDSITSSCYTSSHSFLIGDWKLDNDIVADMQML